MSPPAPVDRTRTEADTGSLEDQIAVMIAFVRWAVEGVDDDVNFEHVYARMSLAETIERMYGSDAAEEAAPARS